MKKLSSWLRWICGGLIVIGLVSLVVVYWEWFATEPCGMESRSTTARNVGILFFGLIAIGFGIWRGVVASRQSKTSQRGLLNERYQKGAEMLGSEVLSVRLGGIYALQSLAEDEPEQYHVKTMRLLCAFVRHLTENKDYMAALKDTEQQLHRPCEDVQAAMTAIGTRSEDDMELEKQGKFSLILNDAQLNGADLTDADLTDTHLDGAYLNRAYLNGAHLTDAQLNTAQLNGAHLDGAYLTGADFSEAKGLTQKKLDQAWADPGNPPQLGGLCDVDTGEPLEWRGQPCRK